MSKKMVTWCVKSEQKTSIVFVEGVDELQSFNTAGKLGTAPPNYAWLIRRVPKYVGLV